MSELIEFIPDPCVGVFWQCTDGKYSGYGDTKREALAGWLEAKRIKRTQPVPRIDHRGKRKHW